MRQNTRRSARRQPPRFVNLPDWGLRLDTHRNHLLTVTELQEIGDWFGEVSRFQVFGGALEPPPPAVLKLAV